LTASGNDQSKRAGRLRADAARNRVAILDAAEAIFGEKGPAMSTEEVARRASVGIGTIFRHYPTKRDLIEAVVVARLERLTREADALTVDDRGEALFGFFERIVAESADKRTLVHSMSALGIDVGELMREAGAGFRAAVKRLLTRAQERRVVRPDVEVGDVLNLLRALAYAADVGKTDPDVRRRALAVVIDGLRYRHSGK
jgi:AcrR family transcriptional regulator